jgi:pyruvate dehydrogenase E1 component
MTSIRAEDPRTDPEEVAEWVGSFDQLVAAGGRHRAASVLHALAHRAAAAGVAAETAIATDYVNTIPVADEPPVAGDEELERRFRRLIC